MSSQSTTARRWIKNLYILTAAFTGLALFLQASPQLQQALDETHWDLSVDRLTALAFLNHYSPFTPEGAVKSGVALSGPAGNGHPPTTSFWFLPIARMDNRQAGNALAWVSILLLLLELAATMTTLRYPAPFVTAWVFLTYMLDTSFMKYHVGVGQISALIGFLYFVAWHFGRSGEDWLAGAALGVACTLKVFPGVMVVLFLIAFRWRAVLAAIVVYLGVAIYMTAGFGLSSWPRFLAQQAPIADLWMSNIQNQSIHGVVLRLFQPVCVPHGGVLFAATLISSAISFILVGLAVWVVRRVLRTGAFDLSYALFVVLSMVTSQWTWEHYSVIYALPVMILFAELMTLWRLPESRLRAAVMFVMLGAVVASWQISMNTKVTLQGSVHMGNKGDHLRLHLYDLLNWGPGIVLLGLLFAASLWKRRGLLALPDLRGVGRALPAFGSVSLPTPVAGPGRPRG